MISIVRTTKINILEIDFLKIDVFWPALVHKALVRLHMTLVWSRETLVWPCDALVWPLETLASGREALCGIMGPHGETERI